MYIIFSLITIGFVGLLVFEGINDEGGVEAAQTLYVGGSGPGNYSTIGSAISSAQPGDTIRVFAGKYEENLIIDKKISLIGNGSTSTIIDGDNKGSVIYIKTNFVIISGFTLRHSGEDSHTKLVAGIYLNNANNITIKHNNCSLNIRGILLYRSSYNAIINNNFFNNNNTGIELFECKLNKIVNNTMFNCSLFIDGELLEHYNSHIITLNNTINKKSIYYLKNKNKCNIFNSAGQVILANCTNITIENHSFNRIYSGIGVYFSKYNIIKNNNCSLNIFCGIYIKNSNNNLIVNNSCNLNKWLGICMLNSNSNIIKKNICNFNFHEGIGLNYYSNWNRIENNSCNFNSYGIKIGYTFYHPYGHCNYNTIIDNICNSNSESIYLYKSTNNSITNNLCMNNGNGISFYESKNNTITQNICNLNNWNGIYLEYSHNNTILGNLISNNNKTGFLIELSNNNYFFHNNIITNTIQTTDTGNNNWNNSNQEGNYWSDYNGSDDGNKVYLWDIYKKHLIAGDGIGDTLVPHLGLDYYPFTNKLGWLKPGTPILNNPGDVNSNGNYNLTWISTARTTGYILEEDNSSLFDSPIEIYNSSAIIFNISRKNNGTYYYRVKAYNEKYESLWSNIVDIIVDWLPEIPENLSVSTYPPGNTLNLSWNLNLVDTNQYILEYKNETMANWQLIDPILHPEFTFNHTGLVDGERYDYRIQARDHRGQLSNFSEIIYGIPWDSVPPAPPTGLKVISTTNDSISLNWNLNTEDDLEGYHLFKSKVSNPNEWGEPIGTIPKGTEDFIDTGLDELTTFYYILTAFDEVPNNSSYSNMAYGTTILGPHGPLINNSIKDFSIPEDTIDDSTINLYYWFMDINNDILEFTCEGQNNISVTIFQKNGTVILIPKKDWNGKETLIFYANDSVFEMSDDLTITVTPVNDPPGPAVIITPKDGIKVENGTLINFSGICDDVDLIYGDELTFNWSSNISGRIGSGENLTNIILQLGYHQITLEVMDIVGETSIDIVDITILGNKSLDHKPEPKFDLKLELVPNIVELKPGEQTSIKAMVTNLGNLQDKISLTYNTQTGAEIEVSIIGDQKKVVESNKTAEFQVNIKIPVESKKGEIIIIFSATSGKAIDYEMEVKKNAPLTIKVLEENDTAREDKLKNLWWIIILVIIIIIVILLFILIKFKKKKEAPEKELEPEADVVESDKLPLNEKEVVLSELDHEE